MTLIIAKPYQRFEAVNQGNPDIVWAKLRNGDILNSTMSGDAQHMFLANSATVGGATIVSHNGGTSFTASSSFGSASNLSSLAMSDDGQRIYAAFSTAAAYRVSTNGGTSFGSGVVNGNSTIYKIAASADGITLVCQLNTLLWTSSDAGGSWTRCTGMPAATVQGNIIHIAISPDGSVITALNAGLVYVLTNSGTTAVSAGSITPSSTQDMVAMSNNAGVIFLQRVNPRIIYKSTDLGVTWTQVPLPAGFVPIRIGVSRDGTRVVIKASSDANGGLLYSVDGGTTFLQSSISSYLPSSNFMTVSADGKKIFGTQTSGVYLGTAAY